jgi:hypothetical protein
MKRITLINGIILFLTTTISLAQVGLYEIDLKQQVNSSDLIVEGKVISKKSFWDEGYKKIYTLNTIEVFKTFKGESNAIIEVLTLGGEVGDTGLTVSHSLELSENETGMFLLNSSNRLLIGSTSNKPKYKVYSGIQGFYKYDAISNKATNVFKVYNDIENDFYQNIVNITNKNFTELKKRFIFSKNSTNNKQLAPPFITNFSPTTANAGTGEEIIITGFFGATKGKVQFSDANGGGVAFIDALDSEVTNWTDASITVRVPSRAGTGIIRVLNADGFSDGGLLTVPYAIINSAGIMQQHYNTNGSGGYTWQMSADFNNDVAKAPFLRAFNTWVCATGVNWVISPTTTLASAFARDGISVIAFDTPGDELDPGVLGATLNWTSACTTGRVIDEIDFIFDNERSNWAYGPAAASGSEIDFEFVVLHELGHGHALAHIISPGALMHYAISNGARNRILSANDVVAGNFVHDRSINNAQCDKTVMTSISCPSLNINEEILNKAINLFPNPTKGILHIKNDAFVNLEKVAIYDISGRLISQQPLSNTSKSNIINLAGMSKGIYFVTILSDSAVITRKVVLD